MPTLCSNLRLTKQLLIELNAALGNIYICIVVLCVLIAIAASELLAFGAGASDIFSVSNVVHNLDKF